MTLNKMPKKKIGKNKAINFFNNDLVKKAEQISKLKSTLPWQQMLEILNYLGEIFNGLKTDDKQLDNTDMPELENEESSAQRRNQRGQGLKI